MTILPVRGIEGRVAIVTGASSGMGAEIARELARCGAAVVAVGRDQVRLAAIMEDIESTGSGGLTVCTDLTEDGSAAAIVARAVETFGHLDILVNSAGIFRAAPFEAGLEGLDDQWQINVRAPYTLTQAAIPYLRQRRGSVIFVSSVSGSRAFPDSSGYCTTKGAVESLAGALAVEEAPNGVRVNTIAPGEIRTAMNQELLLDRAFEQAILDATPLGRIGTPQEIAPAVAFLVSDAASYITGACLAIDGGWLAG